MLVSTIIFTFVALIYIISMYIWMQHTFKNNNNLNYFIFRNELQRYKKSLMHYIEITMLIILLIAIITTLISQIQIWFLKTRKS